MATRLDYFYVQLRGLIAGLGLNENNQGQSQDAVGPYLAGGQYATPDIQLVVHYFCGFGEECASNDHPSNVQEAVKNHGGRWRGSSLIPRISRIARVPRIARRWRRRWRYEPPPWRYPISQISPMSPISPISAVSVSRSWWTRWAGHMWFRVCHTCAQPEGGEAQHAGDCGFGHDFLQMRSVHHAIPLCCESEGDANRVDRSATSGQSPRVVGIRTHPLSNDVAGQQRLDRAGKVLTA